MTDHTFETVASLAAAKGMNLTTLGADPERYALQAPCGDVHPNQPWYQYTNWTSLDAIAEMLNGTRPYH